MSIYFVEFTAYINERMRPENFPKTVQMQETFKDVKNTSHLQMMVNERFVQLVTSAGLIALKDPSDIIDSGVISFDKRWYVPWHMITHMGVRVELIPESTVTTQDMLVPVDPDQKETKREQVN